MTMKLLSTDGFRAAAKDGGHPEGTVFRFSSTQPETQGEDDARTMRFVFSDATIDHSGDSIDPKGWDLSVFKRNPVALFSHMSWEPPIGRASNVAVQNAKLMGDIEFATAEVYPFADTIYRLIKGGFMNAVSVGFLPTDWVFSSDKDRPYGIDFKKQTLLEISPCPVPCNPNALGEARSLGIDTAPLVEWAEKVLDTGDVVFMPRKDVETLRTQAKAVEPTRFYIQTDKALGADQAKRLGEAFERWQKDPGVVLVLDGGLTLRSTAELKAENWTCGAARDLPLDDEGTWNGSAAEAAIFAHAGGDGFDPDIARQGFLVYDSSLPKLRGSYKLPFADVIDGKLTARASGIRAAASRLPDTDIPDGVKTTARAVIDHYEAQMTAAGKTAPQGKAGRRISAATKAKLQQVVDYHAAATKCVQDIMDADEQPGDDAAPDAELTPEPMATVIPDDMTPEQRRLKEARDLKASLPTND